MLCSVIGPNMIFKVHKRSAGLIAKRLAGTVQFLVELKPFAALVTEFQWQCHLHMTWMLSGKHSEEITGSEMADGGNSPGSLQGVGPDLFNSCPETNQIISDKKKFK